MFVAVSLSPTLRGALTPPVAALAALGDLVRTTDISQAHLTLHFLGGVDPSRLAGLRARLKPVLQDVQAFEVAVQGVGAFPSVSRAHVVWAGVADSDGRLLPLHRGLGAALVETGFELEARAFRPHLTLARIRRQPRIDERRQLAEWMQRWRGHAFGRLPVKAVLLMRSQPGGQEAARYTVIERFGLK